MKKTKLNTFQRVLAILGIAIITTVLFLIAAIVATGLYKVLSWILNF